MIRIKRWFAALVLALAALIGGTAVWAQSFPALSGRVVDAANVIPADEKARLETKLAALETQSHRQLVVATVPDLQGYEISDYGYQLGRHWGIGAQGTNDGAILLVAPKEHKVRIEVGYGLEGIVTDGWSELVIQEKIIPRFKAGDLPGGIEAGTDALIAQLQLPPDQARAIAAAPQPRRHSGGGIPISGLIWLGFFFLFFILPMLRRMGGGSRYHSSGLGPIIMWNVLDGMTRGGGGGGWSGGGGSDWGGGGGFSGGGGSFGGGGASGSW